MQLGHDSLNRLVHNSAGDTGEDMEQRKRLNR